MRRDAANAVFHPSQPIRSPEMLFGRHTQLQRTMTSLETPGRSVFIYGERGVGKTSLAQTAAYMVNSSETEPVFLSCSPDTTFSKLVVQIASRLLAIPVHKQKRRTTTTEANVAAGPLSLIRRIESSDNDIRNDLDTNDAVDLFNEISKRDPSRKTVVVLDEIDTIRSADVRRELAYLLKQLGDRECPVKFIYVGIADTVEELLSDHESASRYIATVPLERLSMDVLSEMVVEGFKQLGIELWEHFATRIARVSDGFAHFTHLISLKLAYIAIDNELTKLGAEHIEQALAMAVEDSEAWLKNLYEHAVQKYRDRYEAVLWSAADHWQLDRSTDHMYPAYLRICGDLRQTPLPRPKFSGALNALKGQAHGQALVSKTRSWFRFRQAMLRGYCRMVAESRGIQVGAAYLASNSVRHANGGPTTSEC